MEWEEPLESFDGDWQTDSSVEDGMDGLFGASQASRRRPRLRPGLPGSGNRPRDLHALMAEARALRQGQEERLAALRAQRPSRLYPMPVRPEPYPLWMEMLRTVAWINLVFTIAALIYIFVAIVVTGDPFILTVTGLGV